MDGLLPRLDELEALGVNVMLVGNGPVEALPAFVREHGLERRAVTVVTDPSLAAFRAAGLRRPRFHGVRAAIEALRALGAGDRVLAYNPATVPLQYYARLHHETLPLGTPVRDYLAEAEVAEQPAFT